MMNKFNNNEKLHRNEGMVGQLDSWPPLEKYEVFFGGGGVKNVDIYSDSVYNSAYSFSKST